MAFRLIGALVFQPLVEPLVVCTSEKYTLTFVLHSTANAHTDTHSHTQTRARAHTILYRHI